MLQPTDRATLIASLAPPPGFEFDDAMAVTYTLDLKVMLAAPAALALRHHEDQDDSEPLIPVDVLHALRTHADRITVFAQAGEIALPSAQKAYGFLDGSVVPVTAPRGGVVHPKVWVLRFRSTSDPDTTLMRMLISSRNLTFDSSWDTLIRLDSTDATGDLLPEAAELFRGLLTCSVNDVSLTHSTRIESLAEQLLTTRFALPEGVDSMRLHLFGFEAKPSPFPLEWLRSIVVSPFVTSGFFSKSMARPPDILVSRPEALAAIANFDGFPDIRFFDDGSVVDYEGGPIGPAQPLHGLHAKIFGFENRDDAQWFLGSANATDAAFNSNVEVLLEIIGSRATIGIDAMFGDADEAESMWRLFPTYLPAQGPIPVPEPPDVLNELRRQIGLQKFRGFVTEEDGGCRVIYSSDKDVVLPPETSMLIWPVTIPGSRRPVPSGVPLNEGFNTTLEALSGFLGCELSVGDEVSTFCIPVPLEGVPDGRDAALMRSLIGNAQRFFAYLLALLSDDDVEDSLGDGNMVWGNGEWGDAPDGEMPPVLERMLRSMRTSPAKLLDIQPLVKGLSEDAALPDGFEEVWNAVLGVSRRGK